MNFGDFYRFYKYRGALEGIHIIKIIPLDTGYFIFLDFKGKLSSPKCIM